MAEEELKTGVQFEGKEEYIKDVFTEIADYYDEMNEIMSMHMVQGWHRFMMRKAGDIRGKRCLDVGTGTGEIAFHVARTAGEGSTVVGVDITPRMLELAARKESELDLLMEIYGIARAFMVRTGNPGQWKDSYPGEDPFAGIVLCITGQHEPGFLTVQVDLFRGLFLDISHLFPFSILS